MLEHPEGCPDCGCTDGQSWIHDDQVCLACGYGRSATQTFAFIRGPWRPEGLPRALADKTSAVVLIEAAERELREAKSHIDSLTVLLAAATLRLSEGAK
ncbi:hypothetical protein [Stappia indica]|uniref:Uncharacterized protein n=1 Tax=Stappia indica TaxID=538381 RepID=A0A857C4V0_9HYPH|nr:hypothetical protein [Stappia indica]QGZ33947.1 hypothetical protein GH266_05125 [Stappia indica]